MLSKLTSWINRVLRWLAEPWAFWLAFAALTLVPASLVQLFQPAEDGLRYSGLALELLGVVTVVHDLNGRGILFQQPPLHQQAAGWIRRFPRFSPPTIELAASVATESNMAASLGAVNWYRHDPMASLGDQLIALAQNVETLRTEISRTTNEHSQRFAGLRKELANERASRAAELHSLSTKVKDLGASDLNMERVGIAWLVCGMILSAIPGEILLLWNCLL